MQRAAKNNLFLTDLSSKQLFERKHSGRLYQQIVLGLIGNFPSHSSSLVGRLIDLAEHAYAYRRMDLVGEIGSVLTSLPLSRQFEAVGRYYKGLAMLRENNLTEARVILERAASEAPPFFRAMATLSIGVSFLKTGDLEAALFAYNETPALSRRNGSPDPLVSYISRSNAAVVKSMWGDHRAALADLEALFPVARSLASIRPKQYYNYLNSLATELGEAGRVHEAQSICAVTMATPYAHAYTEWRETANEIALKAPRRSSNIALPSRLANAEASNVFPISVDRNTSTNFPESSRTLPEQQARVLSFTSWKTQMSREPLAKPKPRVSVGQMTRKQKIIRIVDLVCNEISDEQLDSILLAVERIAPDEKVKD
jgi:tetratricopeptide (TPR) repeat protein